MENPKCPYCGEEMLATAYSKASLKRSADWARGNSSEKDTRYCFQCVKCEAESPLADTFDEAYAAAMSRNGAKGYLAYRAGHYWGEDGTDYPDIYVYVNGYCSECGHLMCCAGATTIHYPDELMYTDKDWDYRKELIEAEDKLLEAATQRKVGITNFCPNCGADMRKEANDER